MAIELTDDGTMDTVLRCSDCGEEFRYSAPEYLDSDIAQVSQRRDGLWVISDLPDDVTFSTERDALAARDEELRETWIEDIIEECTDEHECAPDDDDDEARGPQDDDLTTTDHRSFYRVGSNRLAFTVTETSAGLYRVRAPRLQIAGEFSTVERAIRAYMQADQYWPNCWVISDHGNAHLMDLSRA